MAYEMKQEGYDAVIPYNWVAQSNDPGEAIKQSPKLARSILHAASKFPASAPVNLDFIGHSEGTVINTYAIVKLEDMMTPGLRPAISTTRCSIPTPRTIIYLASSSVLPEAFSHRWPSRSSRIIRRRPRIHPYLCHP